MLMSEPDSIVRWDQHLPSPMFSRTPVDSLFFDGGVFEKPGFLQTLDRWSSLFTPAGLSVSIRVGAEVEGVLLNANCEAIRRKWAETDTPDSRRYAVFDNSSAWALFEDEAEDFGVLCTFRPCPNELKNFWPSMAPFFFTKLQLRAALNGRASPLGDLYTQRFLEGLATNY